MQNLVSSDDARLQVKPYNQDNYLDIANKACPENGPLFKGIMLFEVFSNSVQISVGLRVFTVDLCLLCLRPLADQT